MNFEQALNRINELLIKMEISDTSLEETVVIYKEATELLAFCKAELEKAELLVTVKGENSD